MKTGLIVEGGGMKCAYSAGVLDKFIDRNIQFDYVIGVSAGSANAASFIAHQRGRNKRFYTKYIGHRDYFGMHSLVKTGNLFGLNYIYGNLTNTDGEDPLDYDAMMANPCEYKVVATNATTGLPVYFDKSELIKDDYKHIMASCAIPIMCKPVEINGEYYFDGSVSDSIPIQKALDDGCDKVVIILSKTRDYVKKPQSFKKGYSAICRKYPKIIEDLSNRHIMYTKQQEEIFALEKKGKVFILAPSHPPKMSTYTMDKITEDLLYELGVSDFKERENRLKRFMQG